MSTAAPAESSKKGEGEEKKSKKQLAKEQAAAAAEAKAKAAAKPVEEKKEEEDEGDAGGVYARDLAKTLERYAARVASVLKIHTDTQLSDLANEKSTLQSSGEAMVDEHRGAAERSWHGYDNFKVAAEEQRKLLKFLRVRELDRQLSWHAELLDAERNWVKDAALQFDEDMKAFSTQLVEKFEAERPRSPREAEDPSAPMNDKALRAEKEKNFKKAVADAEAHVKKGFEDMVSESRREWLVGQRRALLRVEEELRAAHENGAIILERQAKAGEHFGKAAQERWKSRLRRSRAALQQLAEAYEVVLRKAYEDQIREVKLHVEEQADFYRAELKDVHDRWEHDRRVLQAQLRKMRIALAKWRHDYAVDAENRAVEAVKSAAERASHSHEPQTRATLIQVQAKAEEPDGLEQLKVRRETLQRLWRGLESSEDEIKAFYRKLERTVPFTSEALSTYDSHLSKYGKNLMQESQGAGSAATFGPCQKISAIQSAQAMERPPEQRPTNR